MNVLVTGGAGFIGSNFVRHFLQTHPNDRVINLDLLTYAGNLDNLSDLSAHPRYQFVRGDITDASQVDPLAALASVTIHFAAESHVDRSITDAWPFVRTNVCGTDVLLAAARRHGHERFIHISTDEVYGSREAGYFDEASPLSPTSPYAASKAASDLLALSYYKTHGLPVVVTRCTNNYGPYQFPEKMIPLMILSAIDSQPLPVYGDGLYIRDWLFVHDHCTAIDRVLSAGRPGEIYNIGGQGNVTNLEVVRLILKWLDRPESLIRHVKDRPGHDRRYAVNPDKIGHELGWRPTVDFEAGLRTTLDWYRDNSGWWKNVASGEYRNRYEQVETIG